MKSTMLGLLSLITILSACSKDDEWKLPETAGDLVTPVVTALVADPLNESPLTGILEAYPCNSESSIYFGNYVNGELTPFYGYYRVYEGHTYGEYNRILNLPAGSYNMIYWATPKYEEPIYSKPGIDEPAISIGADLSKQYFGLRPNKDGTYMPVYDLVHAVKETNTADDFQASLKRVVAGLKVIVRKKDNGIFGSEIAKMQIRIHGIAEKINFYTAEPENQDKTVLFELIPSDDGTSMSNATVMLFPSAPTPKLELEIIMRDGQSETLSKNLTSTLVANTRLTLNILINNLNPGGGGETGNFSIENWNEATETIEFTLGD